MELRIEELKKNYGKKCALQGVSVTLTPGIYGLLGPNGAGKSTMMNILAGVLRKSGGRVLLNGEDAEALGREYRSRLGYLPQSVGFYSNFTAAEFLRYMACVQGMSHREQIEDRVRKMLELVNLTEHADRRIGGFSGGMKQRLGIAQAFLHNPDIVILDEPSAGLDPKERIRLRNLISGMAQEKIILLATHIVSDVENLADWILVMQEGRLICEGTVPECLSVMEGRIYQLTVPEKDLLQVCDAYRVTAVETDGAESRVRIVTDTPPEGAVPLENATLEDLYLYYFGMVSTSGGDR